MAKKSKLSEEDKQTFRHAMQGVKPLVHSKVDTPPVLLPPSPQVKKINKEIAAFEFSDEENLLPVGSTQSLYYARPGIQHKMLRKLRHGQYNVEVVLDLHGKTVQEAKQLLAELLIHCQQEKLRHILIIHGKGRSNQKPVLKNKLNHWLRQTEQVLAFCTANPRDGQAGALYVLLRRE